MLSNGDFTKISCFFSDCGRRSQGKGQGQGAHGGAGEVDADERSRLHRAQEDLRSKVGESRTRRDRNTPWQIRPLRKIERLRSSLHLLGVEKEVGGQVEGDPKPCNTHTFFVDSEEEKRKFDPAKRLGTHPKLLGRTFNRPRLDDLASGRLASTLAMDGEALNELSKKRKKAYKELAQRMERERQLGIVQVS